MPVRYVRRRVPYRKKRTYKSSNVVSRVKRLESKVRAAKPEMKYTNLLIDPVNTTYDGNVYQVVSLSQGFGDNQRGGDRINMMGCQMKFFMNSAVTSCAARIIVYIDKRNQTVLPTDVLESGTLGVSRGAGAVNASYVHDYRDRYQVLSDKVYNFSANGRNTAAPKYFFKFRGKPMRFLAGGTTIVENSIYVLIISTNSSGATPQVSMQGRLWFQDP